MESVYIASGTQQLHYLRWQGGSKLLVAFHGYGNHAGIFRSLAQTVRKEYTTISFDLPHHGKSNWDGDKPWTRDELRGMTEALMKAYQVKQITVVCFSIGGRVGLTLAELMPECIDKLILIASDGLVPGKLYHFVTKNPVGKKIFHHFLSKPERYLNFVSWLEERKLIDGSRRKFIDYYVSAPAARAFLVKVWPNLRLIVPNLSLVKKNIDRHHIPTHLFMGRFDRVIPLANAATFAAGVTNVTMHVLEKSHRIMDDDTANKVAQILLAP